MQNRQDAIVDEPAVGFKVLQSNAVVVEDRSRAKLVQMLPQIKVSLLFQKQLVPKHFQRLNLKVPVSNGCTQRHGTQTFPHKHFRDRSNEAIHHPLNRNYK